MVVAVAVAVVVVVVVVVVVCVVVVAVRAVGLAGCEGGSVPFACLSLDEALQVLEVVVLRWVWLPVV